jgi:hypothetical protein
LLAPVWHQLFLDSPSGCIQKLLNLGRISLTLFEFRAPVLHQLYVSSGIDPSKGKISAMLLESQSDTEKEKISIHGTYFLASKINLGIAGSCVALAVSGFFK